MRVDDFDYDLPDELIAQAPLPARRDSRLMTLEAGDQAPGHRRFAELPSLLRAGDLLVLNDTRVIPARIAARKETGGRAEILIERLLDRRRCLAHVRASKSPRAGSRLRLADAGWVTVAGRRDDLFELELEGEGSLPAMVNEAGSTPLPPYIRRGADAGDAGRYQTVYAEREGAVAAPTAGLHFDQAMLEEIRAAGVDIATVTLHVGAGTFQSPRCDQVEDHVMHAEHVTVDEGTCAAVAATRARGARVVAVGTTSVRALETACEGGSPSPVDGDTRLYVYPGYRFRCVDALLTNFHLPRSTLLMLVCAFAGTRRMLDAYREAVIRRYRFFSYGDAMFLTRAEPVA